MTRGSHGDCVFKAPLIRLISPSGDPRWVVYQFISQSKVECLDCISRPPFLFPNEKCRHLIEWRVSIVGWWSRKIWLAERWKCFVSKQRVGDLGPGLHRNHHYIDAPRGCTVYNKAMSLDVLPHQSFWPQYTTYLRTSASVFFVGSMYILNDYLQNTVQKKLFPDPDSQGIKITTRQFRHIRNAFINTISPSTLHQEQRFANIMAMSTPPITELFPQRSPHIHTCDTTPC